MTLKSARAISSLSWCVVVGGLCLAAQGGSASPPGSTTGTTTASAIAPGPDSRSVPVSGTTSQSTTGSPSQPATGSGSQVTTVGIGVDRPGAAIPATLFGIFFEDINFGADGGIYPERVKNRSFEFPDALMGWKRAAINDARGRHAVQTDAAPSPQNPHYLRITSEAGTWGVTNDGFRGIGIRKGERYRFAMLARIAPGTTSGAAAAGAGAPTAASATAASGAPRDAATSGLSVRAELENNRSVAQGGVTLTGVTREWARYTGVITAESTDPRARLRLLVQAPAALDVDMVSLFPESTWQGRENGLRQDLVQLLKDMQPGFIRFPGGCIVEGRFLDGRYQWKTTIGDPADRRLIANRWNDEFAHRATPDYYQTFGLGFFEYFQLAEDLGAEPLPILNCGMACQFNSGELAPLDQIDPYVQDAIDLIEFANGAVTTPWGKRRAEMGHAAPFNLKFMGVGNEQWGPQYIERYQLFAKVLKEKHPEIRLISSAGPFASGEQFDFLWGRLRAMEPKLVDLVDEHYYQPPKWFLSNSHRYDSYPRTGPKVFAGEFAAHPPVIQARGQRPNTLAGALAEAAFMTGLERNADLVELSSYAPLFAHVDAWQWTPNLIWFDNLRSVGTPSYHVQKLFGANRGTRLLPVSVDGVALARPAATGGSEPPPPSLYASASLDEKAREVIVKLVNPSSSPRTARLDLGARVPAGAGRIAVLTGSPDAENTLDAPNTIAPVERPLTVSGGRFEQPLPAHSLTVLRLPIR